MSGLTAILVAALGALASVAIAYTRGRIIGARLERANQAEAENKARDLADQVDNDVGATPPKDAREELRRWSRG
jgi:membrane protein DedA with SNARE-associated domain